MPGAIVHFLVVNRVLDKLSIKSINKGLVYAGSIAPDAVHALPNYVRDDKKKSHLRTGIRDAHFHLEENLDLFHKRVASFIVTNMACKNKDYDFYLGYLIHLYSDELFIRTVRKEYTHWRTLQGISAMDKIFYKPFIKDVELMDSHILFELKNKEEIIESLEQIDDSINILNLEDKHLKVSRSWVINHKLTNNSIVEDTVFITATRVMDFVEVASEIIFNRLFEAGQGLLI